MPKYTITIEEMVSENFEVEAATADEAMEIAERNYRDGTFVLEPGNLVCTQMAITDPDEEATEWIEI